MKEKLLKAIKIFDKPELEILSGNLAFSLAISLVPILTLFVLGASSLSLSIDSLILFMETSFPKDVSDVLVPLVSGTGFDVNIGIALVLGLLIASNGLNSIIVSSNTLYKTKKLSILKRRIKALILTFLLLILFIFILIVLAFGNYIFKLILMLGANELIIDFFYRVFIFSKWPISFIVIFTILDLIYCYAPDIKLDANHTKFGALFTTCSWVVVTAFYSYYLSNVARYDFLYGGLSSIITIMIWIYMLSFIFVIGMAINVAYNNKKEGNNINDIS